MQSESVPKTRRRRAFELFKSLSSTLIFVWFFTSHIAQATVVPTESMMPSILVGDHFMLDKFAFPANYPSAVRKFLPERTIRRGDIIAFWSPEDANLRLVKRVIGLPGETLEMREGEVYIDGKRLDEPYAIHTLPPSRRVLQNFGPVTVPPEGFFMMGDNRDNSRDSRYWGFAHHKDFIGKPLFVYWSYESEPYRDRTALEWADYYLSVATHFFTRTRWLRTGTVLR